MSRVIRETGLAASDLAHTRAVYRRLCEQEPSIPLFSQAWLLDAVAPDRWGAVMTGNDDSPTGSLPYVLQRRFGLRLSTMPALIPQLGPWTAARGGTLRGRQLAREHKILGELADGLPTVDHFSQCWDPEMTNWLPFHWRGYRQTSNYTYRVDPRDPDRVWAQMDGSARTEVRKASERHGLQVSFDASFEEFVRLNELVFARQDLTMPYSRRELTTFDAACRAHAGRLIVTVKDESSQSHAGCYVVWTEKCAYYLLGGADPALRSSGAGYLALWEAIKHLSGKTAMFDFEGSMISSIERVFRSFATHQVPYHAISRTSTRRGRMALAVRQRQRRR